LIARLKQGLRWLFCRQRADKWLILLLIGAGLFGFRLLGITCLWLEALRFPCPGCGFTRALGYALRGQFSAAWAYHPMFWSAPLLVLQFFADGRLFRREVLNRICLWVLLVGFGSVWVLRLALNCYPFWSR